MYTTLLTDDDTHVQRELKRFAALFDTVEHLPLTKEQRIAAVTMAPRNVLIAAAGSGKTSTMVGKVAYALCSGLCTPDQILVLAFNRKAADELNIRLRKCLGPLLTSQARVSASTLHALGLQIVTWVRGRRILVHSSHAELLPAVLKQLVHHDMEFAEQWLLFRVFYHAQVRHPAEFRTRKQWNTFVRLYGERRNKRHGFLTLRDELLPTQFEQAVANWLYLHDMDYVYGGLNQRTRMLSWLGSWFVQPLSGRTGFFIRDLKISVVCVTSMMSSFVCAKNVICITVDEFQAGTVFSALRARLCPDRRGIKAGRMARVMSRLGYALTPGQTEFLSRFIRIARMGNVDPECLADRAQSCSDPARARLHSPMLARLLTAYEQTLMQAESIDFEGMLHRAADYLEQGHYKHAYTLILVDEFQDTSLAGVRLINALLAQDNHCKLFVVGDDWQSIYRFAGALPQVLSHFSRYFGAAVVNHLTATFRFDQSIADLASHFVQTNPAQLQKTVRARAPKDGPSIVLASYGSPQHMFALCEACLHDSLVMLNAQNPSSGCVEQDLADGRSRQFSVYILGRYRHQRPPQIDQWNENFSQLHIQFQTVHAAKGLEADVVIVLGLHTGRFGFPSQVRDDPLLSLVMPAPEVFPYAEERRLFYVALTRSRRRVYLLADICQPSPFVTELIERAGMVDNAGSDSAQSHFLPII